MVTLRAIVVVFALLVLRGTCAPGQTEHGAQLSFVTVTSPDGTIAAELSAQGGALRYRVRVDHATVLEPSRIGLRSDDVEVGTNVTLGEVERRAVDESYRFFGAHAVARNHANEATIAARSSGETFFVDVHAANDGVAVRVRLPAKPGRTVQADTSTWKLPTDPTVWTDKFEAPYESPYHQTNLFALGSEPQGLPLTARVGKLYVTLTEALVKDYGDLNVHLDADGALAGSLYAAPKGWMTDAAVVQPWRVTLIARDLSTLVNSTLVSNLNPPPSAELARADWIKPGRSSWQWLATGDPVETEQTQWIDWTAQLGFEYYLIDEGWSHWKDPWPAITTASEYARSKNVKVWIWVHSRLVRTPEQRRAFFRKAVDAGVVGVKIDFPPPANRDVANWYFDTAEDAARVHLMVDFHGASKPTGMDRTWPNVLTREGVRGHEWHITRYNRVLAADHDVILPFTRYIAGPGDYTPTVFTAKELQGNTWGHELAQAVVFTSPFLCFGGHPQEYLSNPAKDILAAIPSVWDETRVLSGSEPGKLVLEARRRGDQWFIAAINGAGNDHATIPLRFLKPGQWTSTELRDADGKVDEWSRTDGTLNRGDVLNIDLQPRGGYVAWLRRK